MTASVSLVLPTHRSTYSAIARALALASLEAKSFQVVVRDNSENENKRVLLQAIDSPALTVHFAENRGPFENAREALRLATGEFVLLLGDDDWFSIRGLQSLSSLARGAAGERSIACVSGIYLIESLAPPRLFAYTNLDSHDPAVRVRSYIDTVAPNVLYYSLVRRELLVFCTELLASFPYKLSYHDQLLCLLYVAHGRVVQQEQLAYHYDIGEWETWDRSLAKDRSMYAAAGLPAEFDRLQWLLCGLEGALLLRSQQVSVRTGNDGLVTGDIWFAGNLSRFKQHHREHGYAASPVNVATARLRDKYMAARSVDLSELLMDVTDVLELIDTKGAELYFAFWSSL